VPQNRSVTRLCIYPDATAATRENETYKAETRREARPHTVAIADKVVMRPEMRKARAAEGLIPGAASQ
jgi:hypothetical protein